MKAIITFEESPESPDNLAISLTFDPPITPETKETVVTKAVNVVLMALKENTTAPVEESRIILP